VDAFLVFLEQDREEFEMEGKRWRTDVGNTRTRWQVVIEDL
jgi:hypothetical protein